MLCRKYSANRIRAEIKEKNESFGTSLLLANIGPNSPNTPKIVDGSFAALFDTDDVVVDFSKKLKTMHRDIHTNCKSGFLQNICCLVYSLFYFLSLFVQFWFCFILFLAQHD